MNGLQKIPATGWIILAVYSIMALLSAIIANDKALICSSKNRISFPAFRDLTGFDKYESSEVQNDCSFKIYPPIRFKADSMEPNVQKANPPGFRSQNPDAAVHWLGTDKYGRDVAAGLVYGARTAALVGGLTTIFCLILGLGTGMSAGYFRDNGLKWNRFEQIVFVITTLLFIFYVGTELYHQSLSGVALLCLLYLVFVSGSKLLNDKMKIGGERRLQIPLDFFLMKVVELRKSIPALFFILAALSLFRYGSVFNVVIIAGLLGWVEFARYARAETMKLASENYVQNARILGYPHTRILWRYILPGILPTIWVVACFSAGGFILLESTLSFLGIGIPVEEISWGKLLAQGRDMKAWWLVVFPGFALFLLIWALNYTAQKLQENR
jgi:peptide/nickel transport system permease protein